MSYANAVNAFSPMMNTPLYDDLDIDFSSYNYGGFGSGSIFGGMTPMMGMGYGYGGYNYDRLKEQQVFRNDYMIDQQRMNRNADLKINAPLEAIKGTASILKDKIVQNEQGQILEAYNNFLDAVRAAYGEGTSEEIAARAKTLYAQMNGGKSLVQDLRENGHGSTVQGFLHGMSFGLYDSKSAEDNISEITNAPVSTTEKVKQNGGRLAGAATLGGITGGIMKACGKGKAGLAGLVVAGAAALMTFITGKVTT